MVKIDPRIHYLSDSWWQSVKATETVCRAFCVLVHFAPKGHYFAQWCGKRLSSVHKWEFCIHVQRNSIFRSKRPKRAVGALGLSASAAGSCWIFTRAVSGSLVWPHVSNHIFLYKFMRTRVSSPFTDIVNAP